VNVVSIEGAGRLQALLSALLGNHMTV